MLILRTRMRGDWMDPQILPTIAIPYANDVAIHAPTAMWITTISIGKYDFCENPSVFSFIWRCSKLCNEGKRRSMIYRLVLPPRSGCRTNLGFSLERIVHHHLPPSPSACIIDWARHCLVLRIHSQLTLFREASSCRAASEFPDLPRGNSSRDT